MATEFHNAYMADLEDGLYRAALSTIERAIPELALVLKGRWPDKMDLDRSDPKTPVLVVDVEGDEHRIVL